MVGNSVACCSYTTGHCCTVYTTVPHHVLRNSVCIAYATASHLNVMKIIRMKPGAIARRYILLQYYKYCIPSRVVRPCVYDCVILTIVGDWGNQRTPGETSVPFWFLWSMCSRDGQKYIVTTIYCSFIFIVSLQYLWLIYCKPKYLDYH